MSRSLDAALSAQLDAGLYREVHFVYLALNPEVWVHDDLGVITTTGPLTWTGLGDLAGISPLVESMQREFAAVNLSLSAAKQYAGSLIEEALQEAYFERDCTIGWSLRNLATGALYAQPHTFFVGHIQRMRVITGDEQSTIEIEVLDEAARLKRASMRRYTDANQQRAWPGDLGLKYIADLPNKKIQWNGRTVGFNNQAPQRPPAPIGGRGSLF